MIFGYKNDKYLGCSTNTETLEKALKMAGIDTTGMEISDKAPEPPEPPEPTKEEKLAALDSEYEQAKADIFEAYQTAVLMGNTDLQTSIQADFAELNADYAEERTAIING